jgi:hypothetical protein
LLIALGNGFAHRLALSKELIHGVGQGKEEEASYTNQGNRRKEGPTLDTQRELCRGEGARDLTGILPLALIELIVYLALVELQGGSEALVQTKEPIDTPGNTLERHWTQDGIGGDDQQPEQQWQESPVQEIGDRPQTTGDGYQVNRYYRDPEGAASEEQRITETQAQPKWA